METPPRFITFEGAEAVGKSTQIQLLQVRLQKLGHEVMLVREPGGTPIGEAIRHLLKHAPEGKGIAPETELLLFQASRAELVRKVILPSLEEGRWILSDRFYDSTTVYQGVGRKLQAEEVAHLNHLAASGLKPGLTLLLDIPAEESARRLVLRGTVVPDHMESQPGEFFDRVRAGYRALATQEPCRVRIISATGKVEQVAEAIWLEVQNVFSL